MKVKNSIRKKILPSLLIAATLGGGVNTAAFALDNSSTTSSINEVSMFSKEETQKILEQMSRTRGVIRYYNTANKNYVLISYGGYLYLFDLSNKQLLKGLVTVGDDTFYFSKKDGTAQKGWYNVKDSGEKNGRYYFRPDTGTAYKSQFQTIGHERFYFDSTGKIQMGLFNVGEDTYYGKAPTGVIVTGWYKLSGKRYYFDPMKLGAAMKGWYTDGSAGKMYFHNDGSMASGVNIINGETYLFRPHGKGENCYITTGFYTDNSTGNRYLFSGPNGEAYKGGWYKNVNAATNEAKGMMYFDKQTGVMAKGWKEIDGKRYLFQTSTGSHDAYPKIGWYTDGYRGFGTTYYFDPDDNGAAVAGYKVIDEKECYFDNSGALQYKGDKRPTA